MISLLLTAEMDLAQATAALAALIKYLEVLCYSYHGSCLYVPCLYVAGGITKCPLKRGVCLWEVSISGDVTSIQQTARTLRINIRMSNL